MKNVDVIRDILERFTLKPLVRHSLKERSSFSSTTNSSVTLKDLERIYGPESKLQAQIKNLVDNLNTFNNSTVLQNTFLDIKANVDEVRKNFKTELEVISGTNEVNGTGEKDDLTDVFTKVKELQNQFNNFWDEAVVAYKDRLSVIKNMENSIGDASQAIQKLMNDEDFKRMRDIERNIFYRKFYFKGGIPELKTSDTINLTKYDPRYSEDYIIQARQDGFHTHFLTYNESNHALEHLSFASIDSMFTGGQVIDWLNDGFVEDGFEDEVIKALAGLIYFDKLKTFYDERIKSMRIKVSKSKFNMFVSNWEIQCQGLIKKLENITGVSQRLFDSYFVQDDSLAFDSDKYIKEYGEIKVKLEDYKNKMWEVLKGVNALQICSNNVDVVGQNITIDQQLDCFQKIESENESKKEERNKVEDEIRSEKKDEKGRIESEKKGEKDRIESENRKEEVSKSEKKEDNRKKEQSEDRKEDRKKDEKNEKNESKNIGLIVGVVLAVIAVAVTFGIIFYTSSKKKKTLNVVNEVSEATERSRAE